MSERTTPETDAPILSKSGSDSFSAWLHDYFQAMRFNQKHHLGLGDIRLTLGQQDDLVIAAKRADEAREALRRIVDLGKTMPEEAEEVRIARETLEAAK